MLATVNCLRSCMVRSMSSAGGEFRGTLASVDRLSACAVRAMSSASGQSPFRPGLERVLKLDKIGGLPAEEIRKIWLLRHREKWALSGAVPEATYDTLQTRGRESPFFVLPLPDAAGSGNFTTYVVEAQQDAVMFTPHAQYLRQLQERIGAAPELVVQFFAELRQSHGLILMNGTLREGPEFSADPKDKRLRLMSAQYLFNLYQVCVLDEHKYRSTVYLFNHQPDKFSFEALQNEIASLPSQFQDKLRAQGSLADVDPTEQQ